MAAYFFNVSEGERQNILDQHKKPYDGLRTMGWESKNPQTLYVQDFANDKAGITINSKGDAKVYTNTKIHEQVDIGLLTQYDPELTEEKSEACEQCGSGTMVEGMCNECGYKMEGIDDVEDLNMKDEFDYVGGADNATDTFHEQDMEVDIDEDLRESLENERTTIMEMFQRMKVII